MRRFFGLVIALFSLSCSAGQKADPDFDTSVAQPAYRDTGPTVLIDEAHKNFHTAGGRYKPFANLIANDGYFVFRNKKKFSKEMLTYDILIISNARGMDEKYKAAFSEKECEAVKNWVEQGGALLLTADHHPMGGAAEGLAKQFGVGMSNSYGVEDSLNCDTGSTDKSQLVFSRENGLLTDCPITQGRDSTERIGRVVSFTGQSLTVPENCTPFLLLSKTANEMLVDSIWTTGKLFWANTFTQFTDPLPAVGTTQGVAMKSGRGRVVIMGEAAMLTAQINDNDGKPFGMNVPGNDDKQLALNIMHWLSGLLE
ncbi:MAG TPA: hypothetical protein VI546_04465 [candidate division Zixibacteria bacterium]|nr:hypothetical protein [candidate division Zixibacteria bacterium]